MPDVDRHLPLKPVELLILTILADGDRHGYGIRQDMLDHSNGKVDVEAGNLYRHIRGLEDDGLVTDARAPRDESDERRIYYRLTAFGRRVLAAEMLRLRELVRRAESRGIITSAPARA